MKYTKEQRLDIGRRIYEKELTAKEAAEEYNLHIISIRGYLKLYRETNNLPQNNTIGRPLLAPNERPGKRKTLDQYESMSKEELIQELMIAKVNEARAKKGYEVKGVGATKEYLPLGNKSTKSF